MKNLEVNTTGLKMLGKIRMGEKRGNRPVALDYFVLNGCPELEKLFSMKGIDSEGPVNVKEIPIMFPNVPLEDLLSLHLKFYKGQRGEEMLGKRGGRSLEIGGWYLERN